MCYHLSMFFLLRSPYTICTACVDFYSIPCKQYKQSGCLREPQELNCGHGLLLPFTWCVKEEQTPDDQGRGRTSKGESCPRRCAVDILSYGQWTEVACLYLQHTWLGWLTTLTMPAPCGHEGCY